MDHEPEITEEEKARAQLGAVLIAAAVRETAAPQSLREAIERERARAVSPPARRRFGRLLLGPAGAGAVVATVAAFVVLGEYVSTHDKEGTRSPATIAEVASLSQLPAGSGAPAAVGSRLNVSVDHISFPNWNDVKWRASGRRSDSLLGHRVTTVFYTSPTGAKLGYSIVGGSQLVDWPAGRDVHRGGDRYRVAREGGRTIVVWTQRNHTCVISSPSTVPYDKLVTLAAIEST